MEDLPGRGGRVRRAALGVVTAIVVAGAVTGGYLGLHRTAAGPADQGGYPPARTNAAMAYDPGSHDVVMFGGAGAAGEPLADTWLWDGSSWSQASPASSPPGRFGAQMAWDPQSRRVILLGGTGGSGCDLGGGGIAIPAGGGAVAGPALASGACIQLQDAWAWTGSDWSRIDLGDATGQVGGHSLAGAGMATDPGTGNIVLLTTSFAPASVSPVASAGVSAAASPPSATAGLGIACPMIAAGTSAAASASASPSFACPGLPCRVVSPGGAPTAACPPCPVASASEAGATTPAVACPPCPDGAWTCPVAAPSTLTWVFDGSTFQQVAASPTDGPWLGGDLAWFPGAARLADLRSGPEPEMGVPCYEDSPCPPFPQDVWEWDGASWKPAAEPAGQVAPSFAAAPVTDLSTGDVVGLDGSGATWISTGPTASWTEAGSNGSPGARSDPAMAYDAASGQVLLFGGDAWSSGSVATPSDDTWTWDGHAWTLRSGTPPSPTPSVGPTGSAVPLPAIVNSPPDPPYAGASPSGGAATGVSAG